MAFDPETVKRMEEVFGGNKCRLCGFKAQRMIKNYSGKGPTFFCHDCLYKVKPSATGVGRYSPLETTPKRTVNEL